MAARRAHVSPRSGRAPARHTAVAVVAAAAAWLAILDGAAGAGVGTAAAATSQSSIQSSTQSSTVWLCRPGLRANPCTANLTTSVTSRNGTSAVQRATPATRPPVDCFYVYPTVSTQPTINANLRIDPEERTVARQQASRFSQVCRVYAPMYPQLTLAALDANQINARTTAVAYRGLLSAWKDYLARYNQGRGVVLIGHSQGAALLIGLIKREIDPNPAERRLLVSALLMGGNVLVPTGKVVGGDFVHVPACQAETQTGCVVAYSTFSSQPSASSSFGRPASSINGQDGFEPASTAGLQVLCTNPASLAGGPGWLLPYFLEGGSVRVPWVSYPNLYRGQCLSAQGATWLQVTAVPGPNDDRPVVASSGSGWGLHSDDVALALGNLVQIVRDQSAAYTSTQSPGSPQSSTASSG